MDMESPILVRLFKEESELEVWKQDRDGRFALLKTYPICRWSGELGPKIKEGDRQAPEGFYSITPGQMNPNSQYYLSFDLGYPNAFDRAHGRTGAQLMVHGDCSSRGCYSMTDEQISEIYALGRESFFGGQKSFQVQAYPFRMTRRIGQASQQPTSGVLEDAEEGQRSFRGQQLEPKVHVCDKRYVFDAQSPNGRALSFSPAAACPAYDVPEEIASLVRDKEHKDEIAVCRSEPPQYRDSSDQDQRRRRHASGFRRSRTEEPARRRAAGTKLSWCPRRPEPFRRRCGRRASHNWPRRRLSLRPGRHRLPQWRLPTPRHRNRPRSRAAAACSAAGSH